MAARRPWRTAAFADLSRDGSDDEAMPDARASGEIRGARFEFAPHSSPTPVTNGDPLFHPFGNTLAPAGKKVTERARTQELLERIQQNFFSTFDSTTGKPEKNASPPRLMDLLDPVESFKRLKLFVLNTRTHIVRKAEKDVKELTLDNSASAFSVLESQFAIRLNSLMQNVLRYFAKNRVEFPPYSTRVTDNEVSISNSVENVVLLKQIYDLILTTEASLRAAAVKDPLGHGANQEPPFFPTLSSDERHLVWAWVKAREEALDALYGDPTYVFAMKVAGRVNMPDFGVENLISASHQQRITTADFDKMPPAHYDDARVSSERSLLLERYIKLRAALQASKIEDLKRQQIINNLPENQANDDFVRDNGALVRKFRIEYGITDEDELPSSNSEAATFDTMVLSPLTRDLQFNVETIDKALKGVDMENSRKRLLWATNWMQRPEVSGHADLKPLFIAALGEALMRIHQFAPALEDVDDYNSFIETDFDVTEAFAEMVALEIIRIKFFSPTRTQLDRTGDRTDKRERRLLKLFAKFFYDEGTQKVRKGQTSRQHTSVCNALYAF